MVGARAIAAKFGDHVLVDLKLDGRLKPHRSSKAKSLSQKQLINSFFEEQNYITGSVEKGSNHHRCSLGLFGCLLEASQNHWIFRTSPDDWWFPVARRIAQMGSNSPQKNVATYLDAGNLQELNETSLLSCLNTEMNGEYDQVLQNDFETTSGPTELLASQMHIPSNANSNTKAFGDHSHNHKAATGLRGLELRGSVPDWERLERKLQKAHQLMHSLGFGDSDKDWWNHVAYVYQYLAKTRRHPDGDDATISKFWINVLRMGEGEDSIREFHVEAYDGWLVKFLTGQESISVKELLKSNETLRNGLCGWNQVPIKVRLMDPPEEDEATLVAGVMGFVVHEEVEEVGRFSAVAATFGCCSGSADVAVEGPEMVPSIEPHHMWALLLPSDSPLNGLA